MGLKVCTKCHLNVDSEEKVCPFCGNTTFVISDKRKPKTSVNLNIYNQSTNSFQQRIHNNQPSPKESQLIDLFTMIIYADYDWMTRELLSELKRINANVRFTADMLAEFRYYKCFVVQMLMRDFLIIDLNTVKSQDIFKACQFLRNHISGPDSFKTRTYIMTQVCHKLALLHSKDSFSTNAHREHAYQYYVNRIGEYNLVIKGYYVITSETKFVYPKISELIKNHVQLDIKQDNKVFWESFLPKLLADTVKIMPREIIDSKPNVTSKIPPKGPVAANTKTDVPIASQDKGSKSYLKILGVIAACCLLGYWFFGTSSTNNSQPSVKSKTNATTPAKNDVPKKGVLTQYESGAAVLNNNGYGSITLDNSQNNIPVYARIWTEGKNAHAVRTFTIAPKGKFKAENVSPGSYTVRYKFLYENKQANNGSKSEPFTLEETHDADGVGYHNVSITLYKIQDGNMQTKTISANEI